MIVNVPTLQKEHFSFTLYERYERGWFSGIITACHAVDPGSIPGPRIILSLFAIMATLVTVASIFAENKNRKEVFFWPQHFLSNKRPPFFYTTRALQCCMQKIKNAVDDDFSRVGC